MNTKPDLVFSDNLPTPVLEYLNWAVLKPEIITKPAGLLNGMENNILLKEVLRLLGITILEWVAFYQFIIDDDHIDEENNSIGFYFFGLTQFNIDVVKEFINRSNLQHIVRYKETTGDGDGDVELTVVFEANEEKAQEMQLLNLLNIAFHIDYLANKIEMDNPYRTL